MKYATSLNLALWNALTLGLVALGWAYGFVAPVFLLDASHLTAVIAVLAASFVIYSQTQAFRLDRLERPNPHEMESATSLLHLFSDKVFVVLGIVATVTGIVMFASVKAVDAGHASPDEIATAISAGRAALSTGFNGTLCGLLATLWGTIAHHILQVRVRTLNAEVFL